MSLPSEEGAFLLLPPEVLFLSLPRRVSQTNRRTNEYPLRGRSCSFALFAYQARANIPEQDFACCSCSLKCSLRLLNCSTDSRGLNRSNRRHSCNGSHPCWYLGVPGRAHLVQRCP